MEQAHLLQQLEDPSVSHLGHIIGYFGNDYKFWIRELATMPVHVNWYNEPPRVSHFVFKQPIAEEFLQNDAKVRYQRFLAQSDLEWDAGIATFPTSFPEVLLGIRPDQRIFCYTPFLANIFQQLFPTIKVFDIQDLEPINIMDYPSENWRCPYPLHNPRPSKCVMTKLSRMYNWFYTEPDSQESDEYDIES